MCAHVLLRTCFYAQIEFGSISAWCCVTFATVPLYSSTDGCKEGHAHVHVISIVLDYIADNSAASYAFADVHVTRTDGGGRVTTTSSVAVRLSAVCACSYGRART